MAAPALALGGLLVDTPATWAATALRDAVALLNDHAHLEKKAALNALALMHRHPRPATGEGSSCAAWTRQLAAVARDETDHLGRVLRLLERRGATMSAGHRNPYAAALHRHVRAGSGPAEVEDLLFVSALIEARSCERFALLRAHTTERDLVALYTALEASERGHHRVFLELAATLVPAEDLAGRWHRWRLLEAGIIGAQPPGPTMHSGWGPPP